MKKSFSLMLCLLICLLTLAGCSCKHIWTDADCVTAKTCSACNATEGEPLGHTWMEADCVTAKTCSVCDATEGDPLGHTPGEWQETTDIVTATVSRAQCCTVCGEQITSETASLGTMIQDDIFLFTPNEFMERLSAFTDAHVDDFSYKFISGSNLIAQIYCGEKQALVQFFRKNAAPLASDEADVPKVWCVSLTEIDEADANLRLCFYMACDPAMDEDTAFQLDIERSTAFLNDFPDGSGVGYFTHNELLFESIYILSGTMGQDFSMNLVNIYASDFR